MNNKIFKAVKVPFATKKYYSSKSTSKYKIWGHAYYIYDPLTGNIGKQFLQIKGAEYRPTDKEMKLTHYWKGMRPYSKKFREKFLSPFEPNDISKLEHLTKILNDEEVIEFNKLSFEYFNKTKKNFDLLTGSNWGGSKGDTQKAAFMYFDFENDKFFEDEFNLHNFVDFFQSIEKFEHLQLGKTKLEDIETITLNDYLDIFKDKQSNQYFDSAKKVFKSLNYFIVDNPHESEEIVETLNLIDGTKDIDKTYKKIKKNLNDEEYILKKINETIDDFEEELITKNATERILREKQKNLIQIEFKDLKKDKSIEMNISSHLLKEYSGQDHSHIVSVKKCFLKKDYYSIADKNNCLLIPKEYHAMITTNKVTFDYNGNLVDKNCKIISNDVKIGKVFLNEKRIKFLEENYENWVKHKENI